MTGPSVPDLGPVLQEHRTRSALRPALIGLAVLGLTGCALALGVGVWRWYFAYSHYGPAVVWRWSGPAWAVATLSALVGGTALLLLARNPRTLVRVYTHGLTLHRQGRTVWIPWTGIRRIHTFAARKSVAGLTLEVQRAGDGGGGSRGSVRLSQSLEDLDGLGRVIKDRVYPRLLAEYNEALQQGKSLPFGPVVLSSQGVRQGKHSLRWQEMESARLDRGVLAIQAGDQAQRVRIRVAADRLPNLEVFVQLLQQLRRAP